MQRVLRLIKKHEYQKGTLFNKVNYKKGLE